MPKKADENKIEEEISRHICNGQNTFEKLLGNLSGMYPSDVKRIVSHMISKGRIVVNRQGKYILPTFSQPFQENNTWTAVDQEYSKFLKSMHDPHPLDYDWYFSLKGARFIFTSILENYLIPETSLLFLGAPLTAVYFLLAEDKLSMNIKVSIIDKNEDLLVSIKERFRKCTIIIHDLQNELPNEMKEQFEIIIMDPPWYIDYYRLFISRSAELITPDGWLYSSLFPLNTRPHAVQERIDVITLFTTSGFSPWCILNSVLEYETPLFEEKSLQDSGIELEQNWRRGDMIILKSSGYLRPLLFGNCILEDPVWKEISFRKKRIKIRVNPILNAYIRPEVIPLCSESHIPTVSRRHPNRNLIDMWTSDNEAFFVTGHNVVYDILVSIQENKNIERILIDISQKYKKNSHEIRDEIMKIHETLKKMVA